MACKPWQDNSSNGFGTPTVTDLSALVGDPFQGQSMAGGFCVTQKQEGFAGQGSPSEATQLVVEAGVHDFGDATDVTTALGSDAGAADGNCNTKVSG